MVGNHWTLLGLHRADEKRLVAQTVIQLLYYKTLLLKEGWSSGERVL